MLARSGPTWRLSVVTEVLGLGVGLGTVPVVVVPHEGEDEAEVPASRETAPYRTRLAAPPAAFLPRFILSERSIS